MGIKSLTVLLNSKCKSAINKRNLQNYRGMIIGVDISIFIYKYLYNNDDHVEGITRLLLRLLKNGILPLVIFDGRPPKEKSEVITSRREKREYLVSKREVIDNILLQPDIDEESKMNMINQYMENRDENTRIETADIQQLLQKDENELREELEKTVKKIIYVRHEHIEQTKSLLHKMGLPYIVSRGEAETLMAHLCKEDIIDGCISEDTDVLACGGKIFIRNVSSDNNNVDEYCLEGILTTLGVNYQQFIDICILCGSDYTSKINGMGPQTAYKMIVKYGNIENVIPELMKRPDKFQIPEDNFDYVRARNLFQFSSESDNRDEIRNRIHVQTPDIPSLIYSLTNTKIHPKYIQEIDKNLVSYYHIFKNILPEVYTRELVIDVSRLITETRKTKKKKSIETEMICDTSSENTNKKITDFFTSPSSSS
jgi:flap endonuclease-1